MDPPPLTTTTTTITPATLQPPPTTTPTPQTQTTSPHSLNPLTPDFPSFSDAPPQPPSQKLRLMCSFNGRIIPRPHTKSLCYVGGETRMIVINRTTTLSDLLTTLSKTLINNTTHNFNSPPFTLKYQLPNEDLDSLITVSNDDDLDNMIDEYDRLSASQNSGSIKPGRIRLFLFPVRIDCVKSMGNNLDGSEDWFLNAINGGGGVDLHRGFSDPGTVNCLFGLENEADFVNPNPNYGIIESNGELSTECAEKRIRGNQSTQDVHSVPNSKTSSYESTTSTHTPKLENLPQIRTRVDDIEGQFGQISVGTGNGQGQKVGDEGMVVISSPLSTMAVNGSVVDFGNQGYEEERSDYGANVGFLIQHQQQVNYQQQMANVNGNGNGVMSLQVPNKPQQLGGDLASPDSVSSDNSLSSAVTRQKPVTYQDPNAHPSSVSNRFPAGIQLQQAPDPGYPFHPQYDPRQQQLIPPPTHQQQILQQSVQTHPQTQQQQYIPAGAHFVQHPPPGAVPIPAYFPIFPHQQPHNLPHHPYPVYYVPAPSYPLPPQQQQPNTNTVDAPSSIPTQAPPNPTRNMNMDPPKSEMGQSQIQQQHQFVGYSQVHNPPQSVSPHSGGYQYEFTDPSHPQMYYAQPQAQVPGIAPQYQGVVASGGSTMMVPSSKPL